MADDLEARLESHAQAFEGLLSLIPAKEYYSKDNSDQWQRKKQTKDQKREAKRAKLLPQNQKSAKDVMDENERKRKRDLGIDDHQDDSVMDTDLPIEPEQPGQGLRKTKKQKVTAPAQKEVDAEAQEDDDASEQDDAEAADDDSAPKSAKLDKRKEKRRQKKEKADKQKQKQEAKKARKNQDQDANGDDHDDNMSVDEPTQIDAMDFSGLADDDQEAPADSTSLSSPDPTSAVLDSSANQSATSSASSIVPNPTAADADATTAKPKKEKALKLPEVDAEELQARLKARIEQLRAQRKADGPNGQPARNRQELLESRRKKEEARKQHKKELRIKAKQEEELLNNQRLRGSGSPLNTDIFSPRPIDENNFSFGRVAFDTGVEADPTLGSINEHKKKKGPQDTKTALIAAEKKAARLAGYDETKRAEIEEKDMWLNAKKRAHGERVRDDQNLLKKALKRKEKAKTKSATEWNERLDNVTKGKEMKDKRREENLAKRRDDKVAHSKKGGKAGSKAASKSAASKKKGRPGFEGRFKA